MARRPRPRVHNEYFRPVLRGNRKSCSNCREKLEPGESIWCMGHYHNVKWRSDADCCKACWPKLRLLLEAHETGCPENCTITLVPYHCSLPSWMHLRKQIVPTDIHEIEQAIREVSERWKGNCYHIAVKIREAYNIDAQVCYGHYTGPVSPRGYFSYGRGRGFQRHGWLKLWDGRIYDPTRWVFTHTKPKIYVAHNKRDYDLGGQRFIWRQYKQKPPAADADTVRIVLNVSRLRVMFEQWFGRADYVNMSQLLWLCHMPIDVLNSYDDYNARELYAEVVAVGRGAAIPIDQRTAVLGEEDGSPQAVVRAAEAARERQPVLFGG